MVGVAEEVYASDQGPPERVWDVGMKTPEFGWILTNSIAYSILNIVDYVRS
jgi:hypothetical protein